VTVVKVRDWGAGVGPGPPCAYFCWDGDLGFQPIPNASASKPEPIWVAGAAAEALAFGRVRFLHAQLVPRRMYACVHHCWMQGAVARVDLVPCG
jgi:hypothetical protein